LEVVIMASVEKRGSSDDDQELIEMLKNKQARIHVVGVGGAGNNTISRMSEVGIIGATTVSLNTDAQDLLYTKSDKKILIGKTLTKGLGAGANPKIGMEAAKENKQEIKDAIAGSDLVFITCGLGGGTGTGAAPVVAELSKKMGALTVGIVTMPFTMEGRQRMDNANYGLDQLEKKLDTLILIPNDKLLEFVPDVSIMAAFKVSDEILVNSVKGMTELITKPGLVNLDYADIRAVMTNGGLAMIGMGESSSDSRALESVQKALNNPLLDVDIDGAKGALVNITGGQDVTIKECQQIVESISSKLSPDAKIIWGAQIDKDLGDAVQAMVVVTGVKGGSYYGPSSKVSKEKAKELENLFGIDVV
jgi:cell division protein FtsZ